MTNKQDIQSLDDLEGVTWGLPPVDATRLIAKVYELRRKPIGELTNDDIRILVGQEVGLDILLPLAVSRLNVNPLLSADLYPGDLLAAVLRVPRNYWTSKPELAAQVDSILASIDEPATEIQDDISNFRGAV